MISLAQIPLRGNLKEKLFSSEFKQVVTLNAELIVLSHENEVMKRIVHDSQSCCTLDGTIPFWLAKICNKEKDLEKISGSDLIYDVAKRAKGEQKKLFLLGGLEESNQLAQQKLSKNYQIAVEGFSFAKVNYPFPQSLQDDIESRIRQFRPHYLFVGLGALKQERWIYDNRDFLQSMGVEMAVGSGGTFEFVAGTIKRAPRILQKMGLEGIFRLIMEPRWFRLKRLLFSLKIFKYI